jgi:hypothetical protein
MQDFFSGFWGGGWGEEGQNELLKKGWKPIKGPGGMGWIHRDHCE